MSGGLEKAGPWARLKAATPARIGQARAGQAVALNEVLAFQLAHARARDAVHAPLDTALVVAALQAAGRTSAVVESCANSRDVFLRRPDLGRRLTEASAARLEALRDTAGCDLAVVIADGLSGTGAAAHGPALAVMLCGQAKARGWRAAPVVVATQARVALGDEIAAALDARMVIMLIGERPGLTVPDSLGAYLTFAPRPGRTTDADRNCVSNIHAAGLAAPHAAARLIWLAAEAMRMSRSGVALKDESAPAGLIDGAGDMPSI
jgi:ethanolamine ammonia-lyase small subunit